MVRVLVLAAHPDDAEIYAGGLLARHCRLGNSVKIVSITDGRSGHQSVPPNELVHRRRLEAQTAGQRIGAQYVTWDYPDGSLTSSLEVREAIIREIRRYQPNLVLTHRIYDYHPDHRAVGQAVQDASFMVTVPHLCADVPALRKDPVVAYTPDTFTRPCKLRSDVVLDVSYEFDTVVQMLACHESQVFEWLPYHDQLNVPQGSQQRLEWLSHWLGQLHRVRTQHFASELVARGLPLDEPRRYEIYEVSEYAGRADVELLQQLFPGMH